MARYNREGGRHYGILCYDPLQGHDLCNDIHIFEISWLAFCGHVTRLWGQYTVPLQYIYVATAAMLCSRTNSETTSFVNVITKVMTPGKGCNMVPEWSKIFSLPPYYIPLVMSINSNWDIPSPTNRWLQNGSILDLLDFLAQMKQYTLQKWLLQCRPFISWHQHSIFGRYYYKSQDTRPKVFSTK